MYEELDDSSDESGEELSYHADANIITKVKKVIAKLRKIIKKFRTSLVIAKIDELIIQSGSKLPTLAADFHVRWNSTYIMIKVFRRYKDIISKILDDPSIITGIKTDEHNKLIKLKMNLDDWNMLAALEEVLEPFYSATNDISGNNYATMAVSLVLLKVLRSQLSLKNKYKSSNGDLTHDKKINKYIEHLDALLLEKFDVYFDDKMDESVRNKFLVIYI